MKLKNRQIGLENVYFDRQKDERHPNDSTFTFFNLCLFKFVPGHQMKAYSGLIYVHLNLSLGIK